MQSETRFRTYQGYGNLYPAPGRDRSKHCASLSCPIPGLRQSAAGYCRPPGAVCRLRRLVEGCRPDTLPRLRPFVFPALFVQGLPPLPILRPKTDFAVRRVPVRGSTSRPSAPPICVYNPEDSQALLQKRQTLVRRGIPADLLLAVGVFLTRSRARTARCLRCFLSIAQALPVIRRICSIPPALACPGIGRRVHWPRPLCLPSSWCERRHAQSLASGDAGTVSAQEADRPDPCEHAQGLEAFGLQYRKRNEAVKQGR